MGTFCFYHHVRPYVKGNGEKSSFRTHLQEYLSQKFDHSLSHGQLRTARPDSRPVGLAIIKNSLGIILTAIYVCNTI